MCIRSVIYCCYKSISTTTRAAVGTRTRGELTGTGVGGELIGAAVGGDAAGGLVAGAGATTVGGDAAGDDAGVMALGMPPLDTSHLSIPPLSAT